MLPNFLIIGAQKCATTWLREMLRQHPEVYLPQPELHFFDKRQNYEKGFDWYTTFFAGAGGRAAVGEKTPDYLWVDSDGAEGHMAGSHERIARALPQAKLIVMLRDPVERAVSALNHLIQSGRVSPLISLNALLFGPKSRLVRGHGVIEKGFYRRQIDAYRKYYDPSRILVLVFEEDVLRNGEETLRRTCGFLGVDPDFSFQGLTSTVNSARRSRLGLTLRYYLPRSSRLARLFDRRLGSWKGRPRRETIDRLAGLYHRENRRLFEELGRELPWR